MLAEGPDRVNRCAKVMRSVVGVARHGIHGKASGQAGKPTLSRNLTGGKRKRQVVRLGASCEEPESN